MLESVRYFTAQFFLAYVFVAAAVTVDLCMILTYPLRWFGLRNLHRKIVSFLTHCHWTILPAIAQWWSDVEVTLHMKPEDLEKMGKEKAIIVMNHRYQMDWLATWIIALDFGVLEYFKAIVKESLKYVPIVGWSLWLTETIFVKRNAKADIKTLSENFQNFSTFHYNYWLLLFCEGTRLTPEKHKLSVEFATEKYKKPLKHHLMPRSKGFCLVRKGLDGEVSAVYDATVACPGQNPPVLSDFTSGKHCNVDMLIRRIPLKQVPYEESECVEFVEDLYQSKDKLCDFFIKNGYFPIKGENPMYDGFIKKKIAPKTSSLFISTIWSIMFIPPLVFFLVSLLFEGVSFNSIVVCLVLLVSVSLLARAMINSGSVGSSYGKK